MADLLLQAGALLWAVDNYGRTPLHYCTDPVKVSYEFREAKFATACCSPVGGRLSPCVCSVFETPMRSCTLCGTSMVGVNVVEEGSIRKWGNWFW